MLQIFSFADFYCSLLAMSYSDSLLYTLQAISHKLSFLIIASFSLGCLLISENDEFTELLSCAVYIDTYTTRFLDLLSTTPTHFLDLLSPLDINPRGRNWCRQVTRPFPSAVNG